MVVLFAVLTLLFAGVPGEVPAIVIQADGSPVRLDRASILTGAEGPPVLLYSATNLTGDELEQFTVIAYIFNAEGTLKARQIAPGRRTLEARETKYSTMVLDGSAVGPTDVVIVGVNQAQRVGSDTWWRAELQPAAEAAMKRKTPPR